MRQRAYLCVLRNDIPQSALQYGDVFPNTSQRNASIDPQGQTGYINPENAVQNNAIAVAVASDPDGAGGNSHLSTSADAYGLQAYLRERVHVNPSGDDDSMTPAEALAVANAIVARVVAGQSLTLVDVNTILNANLAGADNDLEGTAGDSFGSLEDILKILSGQVYLTPANTVIALLAGNFVSLADRITAIGANTAVFSAQGNFLEKDAAEYRPSRQLYVSGSLSASLGEGQLRYLNSADYAWINHKFYYGGIVEPKKQAAQNIAGTNIPVSGVAKAITVYADDGSVLG